MAGHSLALHRLLLAAGPLTDSTHKCGLELTSAGVGEDEQLGTRGMQLSHRLHRIRIRLIAHRAPIARVRRSEALRHSSQGLGVVLGLVVGSDLTGAFGMVHKPKHTTTHLLPVVQHAELVKQPELERMRCYRERTQPLDAQAPLWLPRVRRVHRLAGSCTPPTHNPRTPARTH